MATEKTSSASDEMLKQMAAESVKQGENLRAAVREMTLRALKTRELSLAQIRAVLRAVTEGVSLGAAKPAVDTSRAVSDAFAGMDEALSKAVEASHLALQELTAKGQEFSETHIKKAVEDVNKVEKEFLDIVKKTAASSSGPVKDQWQELLKHVKVTGTDTGGIAAKTMQEFADRMTATVQESRTAAVRAALTLSKNFATLASGILIGMSEALKEHGKEKDRSEGSSDEG
jgi:uncharacterized protein DUF6781